MQNTRENSTYLAPNSAKTSSAKTKRAIGFRSKTDARLHSGSELKPHAHDVDGDGGGVGDDDEEDQGDTRRETYPIRGNFLETKHLDIFYVIHLKNTSFWHMCLRLWIGRQWRWLWMAQKAAKPTNERQHYSGLLDSIILRPGTGWYVSLFKSSVKPSSPVSDRKERAWRALLIKLILHDRISDPRPTRQAVLPHHDAG